MVSLIKISEHDCWSTRDFQYKNHCTHDQFKLCIKIWAKIAWVKLTLANTICTWNEKAEIKTSNSELKFEKVHQIFLKREINVLIDETRSLLWTLAYFVLFTSLFGQVYQNISTVFHLSAIPLKKVPGFIQSFLKQG